jgi:hypothetical protein
MIALHGARSVNGAQLYVCALALLVMELASLTPCSDGMCPDQRYWREGDQDTYYSKHSGDLQGNDLSTKRGL